MSYKSIFLSLLSATLLILAFPRPDLGFCAWFALVPWFFALRSDCARDTIRPWRAFLLSYLVGLVFFSGTVYWVTYVSYLGYAVLVLYLGLYFAVFGLVFSILFDTRCRTLFLIPAVWVALEYIRSHLFSGFGWALLGYSQYLALPVIQFSDITGAYGVSFLIILANVGIYRLVYSVYQFIVYSFKKKISPTEFHPTGYWLLATLFWVSFSVILTLGYGYFRLNYHPEGQDIKVAVVQGNIPQWQKWNPEAADFILERYFRLTEEARSSRPDIIIWPETSVPGYLEEDARLLKRIGSLSRDISPTYLLAGAPHLADNRKIYNRATLLVDGKIIQRYDKLHLVPFGEFIPLPWLFSRFSFAGLIGDFTPGEEYTIFSLIERPEIKFSALICFEDVFAHLARAFVHKGTRILVNMTNDAWFENSSEPYQHLQASVFRAVENRVNVVRSANTGVSCFINPYGQILNRVSDDSGRDVMVEGEAEEDLQIVSMSSFYTGYGDVFAWLCLFGTCLSLIVKRYL